MTTHYRTNSLPAEWLEKFEQTKKQTPIQHHQVQAFATWAGLIWIHNIGKRKESHSHAPGGGIYLQSVSQEYLFRGHDSEQNGGLIGICITTFFESDGSAQYVFIERWHLSEGG